MRVAITIAVCCLLASSARADDKVAVLQFEGKGAKAVQKKVVKELEKRDFSVVTVDAIGDEPEAKAYVTGTIDKHRKKWRVRITILDAASGDELTTVQMLASSRGQLPRQVSRLLWKRSRSALRKARAASARKAVAATDESDDQSDQSEDDVPTEELEEKTEPADVEEPTSKGGDATTLTASATPRRAGATNLAIGVAGKLYSRRLRYNDDVFTVLNEHAADVTVEVELDASYYVRPWIGVAGSFGLTRPFDSDFEGTAFRTTGSAFAAGVRLRNQGLGSALEVDYGGRSFSIADAGEMAKPAVPDVAYRYLRIGVAADWPLFGAVRAGGHGGYRHVLSNGQITSAEYFPHATSGGVDGAVWLGYGLARAWRVQLALDVERYFFAMNPEPGDMRVAGGAIDQYIGMSVGLAYTP